MAAVLGLLARHALTAAAGIMVHKGIIEAGAVEQLVAAAMALLGVAWSYVEKKRR